MLPLKLSVQQSACCTWHALQLKVQSPTCQSQAALRWRSNQHMKLGDSRNCR